MAHHDHHHMHHMGPSAGGDMMHEEAYRCSMNMLFTWSTENLCLVFRWWHVSGTFSLIMSLLGVVALSAGYEFLRELTRRLEVPNEETSSLLPGSANAVTARRNQKAHIIKATLYGLQVFYSFFIMLLFMTYNGWVMIAVAVGAFVGYCLWGGASATKSVACH
ncbi:ctr copper transporter family protein [Terfezia boudieri ATCC MYA-4762]|uniref:Copper transport protein n=1 Tax=Terfezia boudieri ATCC MYA-4762 TaxID=1051890 RepID=A0A3N4LM39_9PEZI|nr:ctr copper transporter family protein [Terfezia boudieri ATCC MYA-4762]